MFSSELPVTGKLPGIRSLLGAYQNAAGTLM